MDVKEYPRATVILRGYSAEVTERILDIIDGDGLDLAVEVTRNSASFADLKRHIQDHPRLRIGAGTIVTMADAQLAVSMGCQFVLSPVVLPVNVVEFCHNAGVLVIPGAYTPTEIHAAWASGADIVKLFPVRDLSAHYVRDVRGPLGDVPIMAVGGVSLSNIRTLLGHGVNYVGIGSALFPKPASELAAADLRQALHSLETAVS